MCIKYIYIYKKKIYYCFGLRKPGCYIDGQLDRTIQILKDLLRACILEFGGYWEDHVPLVEFTYSCVLR
jgi:hypothetical protein